jgi:hypothetical protein
MRRLHDDQAAGRFLFFFLVLSLLLLVLDPCWGVDAAVVSWVEDAAWFDARARHGCCPAAVAVYEERYARVDSRCCTAKLEEIRKLRPAGGSDWRWVLGRRSRNGSSSSTGELLSSVLVTGDSLAEQHFVALLCLAWSEGLAVDGPHVVAENGITRDWRARVDNRVTLDFVRNSVPKLRLLLDERNGTDVYMRPDLVVVGGWHHGHTGLLPDYIRGLAELRRGPLFNKPTLVVEALASHFPGGKYRPDLTYMPAESNITGAVCDDVADRADPPDVNGILRNVTFGQEAASSSSSSGLLRLLEVAALYSRRGDAHVGAIPEEGDIPGPVGRDCLHWCLAPGVLDALALATLEQWRVIIADQNNWTTRGGGGQNDPGH